MKTVHELLAEAQSDTGLSDFGEDSFREGLEVLVAALTTEARLNVVGEYVLQQHIVRHLSQRLQIEDWYRRHPEIIDEPLLPSLIGLGLPRTGSTALAFLLAQDPQARSLRWFEATHPCPPPSTVVGDEPRIARALAGLSAQDQAMPRIKHLVPVTATGPAECLDLMALDFKSHIFQAYAQIPSYSRWLLYDADFSSTYRYERRVLRLLQWGFPALPWRLKSPSHLLSIDALAREFPDARFVMTHRDVASVLPSVADLYQEVIKVFSDHLDLAYLGEVNVEHWSTAMQRTLRLRETSDDRFYDIDFRAMQAAPIDAVRGLYEWLGQDLSPEFEAGMHRWWQRSGENRDKLERPGPEVFGIEPARLAALFSDYTSRFIQSSAATTSINGPRAPARQPH
jgi:hypothetical protein